MAILPPIRRFVQDDYVNVSTIGAFAGKIFYPLNLFLNAVYAALNNGLTLTANTTGLVKTIATLTTNSSGVVTTSINWPFPQTPPTGLAVLQCTSNTTGQIYPLATWNYSAGVISISLQFLKVAAGAGGAVSAAAASTYSVTFWASAG